MKIARPCTFPPNRRPGTWKRILQSDGSRDAFLPALILIFLLSLPSGCLKRAGPSIPVDETELPDPEAIYREILDRGARVHSLQGTAHLRLQTEQQKASLDAVIACDRQGRLRFEILDWLNHVVFLALFDAEGFLTYSASENEYSEGPEDAEQIQELLGMPLKAAELTALALGDTFFLPLLDPTARMSVDGNSLLLDVESAGSQPRYLVWLDDARRPERMLVILPHSGAEVARNLHVEYGRYRQIDGVSFPHLVRVAVSGSESFLQVDYQRVLLNEPLPEDLFRFLPPEGAKQVSD
jgi:hypothetical protein